MCFLVHEINQTIQICHNYLTFRLNQLDISARLIQENIYSHHGCPVSNLDTSPGQPDLLCVFFIKNSLGVAPQLFQYVLSLAYTLVNQFTFQVSSIDYINTAFILDLNSSVYLLLFWFQASIQAISYSPGRSLIFLSFYILAVTLFFKLVILSRTRSLSQVNDILYRFFSYEHSCCQWQPIFCESMGVSQFIQYLNYSAIFEFYSAIFEPQPLRGSGALMVYGEKMGMRDLNVFFCVLPSRFLCTEYILSEDLPLRVRVMNVFFLESSRLSGLPYDQSFLCGLITDYGIGPNGSYSLQSCCTLPIYYTMRAESTLCTVLICPFYCPQATPIACRQVSIYALIPCDFFFLGLPWLKTSASMMVSCGVLRGVWEWVSLCLRWEVTALRVRYGWWGQWASEDGREWRGALLWFINKNNNDTKRLKVSYNI